jgi:hypothetical protein
MKLYKIALFWFLALCVGSGFQLAIAQINTINDGDFENAELPANWQKVDANDADVAWATDQYRSPLRSLKISEVSGTDAPAWTSSNMAKLQWNSTTGIPPNIEMVIGGWVKTENVNVSPSAAASEITLSFTFYDKSKNMIFGQPVIIKAPQSQATSGWTEIKNTTPIILPTDADSLIITFAFGANATGTAWLDDIFMKVAPGASGWLGDLYNANFGVPSGWFFWKDAMSDGVQGNGVVSITDKYAHRGSHSLLISDTAENGAEVVAISDRNPVEPGRSYGLSAWIKLENATVNPKRDVEQAIFFTITYHSNEAGWAEKSGEDFFVVDQSKADQDWRLYSFTFKVPDNASRISVRARMQHQTTGDTYWDDFRIYPLEIAKANLNFDESLEPASWTAYAHGDATVEWAKDVYRSAERSLKISKVSGDADPLWISDNMAKLQWNPTTGTPPNTEIVIGGWVKTQNVNVNPATAAAEIQLTFSFFDKDKNMIFGNPVVLKLPQTAASTDWVEIKNDVPIILPTDADSLVISFGFGAQATGTAWLDDIFMKLAPGASGWLGDLYNANFGVPDGWFFWKAGMSEGIGDTKGIVTISDKYAHSGSYSLRVSDNADNADEVVAISNRDPVQPNTEYLVSAWVKLEGVTTNPTKDIEKAVLFTVTYHSGEAGWAERHGSDFMVVNQTAADRDWALYTFRIKTEPLDQRISIRARMQHQATGDTYWDDFQVMPIAQVANGMGFEADLPAYWTKANETGSTLAWTSDVSRSPQRSLMIQKGSGNETPTWMTNKNMAKLQWNPTTGIPPNIEMVIGGWVKTENVNTNPANADAEIHLVYTFFDKTKAVIFGQPVVIKIPQTVATSDWTEIKNETPVILPTDADSMSIQFTFGPNAVGTVWLDDIIMKVAPGASGWIGDLYNANFGVPEGWFFWKDQMSEGVADKGVVSISRDAAHTGDYSLLTSDDETNAAEVVAISDRNAIKSNRLYTVQAWVKTVGATVNTTQDVEKAVFFTLTYHTDEAGWAEVGGTDFFVVDQSAADRDWTLYVFTVAPPANATRMSIRARLQHQVTGKVYWDDFAVVEGNVTRAPGQENIALPAIYQLGQNYPNPFNPDTRITFAIPRDEKVKVVIYDLLGNPVRTLISANVRAGEHEIIWDGRDEANHTASSGIYFYVLETKDARMMRKMTLLK